MLQILRRRDGTEMMVEGDPPPLRPGDKLLIYAAQEEGLSGRKCRNCGASGMLIRRR